MKTELKTPLLPGQRIVQICLFLAAAIAIFGGTLQITMGEPETTPRLDNIHRFMAGLYLSFGFIALWTGITIRQHTTLIFLLALTVFLGATGRMISMAKVGLPLPSSLWLAYLIAEIVLPLAMVLGQMAANRKRASLK
jgi:hypothetical protein